MSQYVDAFAYPRGPGDARPTARQVVHDANRVGKLVGKVIVITAGHNGLGLETTRALAVTGATLFLTARCIAKAREELGDIANLPNVEQVTMNQESLDSVRDAAQTILAKTDGVNILINNAAVMAVPTLQLTQDGCEQHFMTNHLSHFLFFNLLKQAMIKAASKDFASRVINLSASAHRIQGINDADNYNFQNSHYEPWAAYAQSKTANIYMSSEIERRFGSQGIHAWAVHPGIIATRINRHLAQEEINEIVSLPFVLKTMKSAEQGAASTVWAAIASELEGRGGKYIVDCGEAVRGPDDGDKTGSTYVGHTYCPELEMRLWRDSLALVALPADI